MFLLPIGVMIHVFRNEAKVKKMADEEKNDVSMGESGKWKASEFNIVYLVT